MTVYNEGLANLQVGRNKRVVRREVGRFLRRENLDILYVCEAAPYTKQMRRAAHANGYRYFTGRGSAARRNTGIFVRRGIKVEAHATLHLGMQRWERALRNRWKGLHPPRFITVVRINGVNLASIHKAPGPYGPRFPLRRSARDKEFRRLRRLTKRWTRRRGAWVLAGDWNMRPKTRMVRRFTRQVGGSVTGRGIDYVISRGVRIYGHGVYTDTRADHNWRHWRRVD